MLPEALLSKKLVIASHNQGKVREIEALLAPFSLHIQSASELGLPEPEETGDTFEANAALKAEASMRGSGHSALADDSGLSVDRLGGAPGIYSARWAGEQKDFSMAMETIRQKLQQAGHEPETATARFVCVLALAIPEQETQWFRGEVEGTLTFPPRGEKGFGYDPIFVPNGHDCTFAEMNAQEKQSISHRTRAFAKLIEYLGKHA